MPELTAEEKLMLLDVLRDQEHTMDLERSILEDAGRPADYQTKCGEALRKLIAALGKD